MVIGRRLKLPTSHPQFILEPHSPVLPGGLKCLVSEFRQCLFMGAHLSLKTHTFKHILIPVLLDYNRRDSMQDTYL